MAYLDRRYCVECHRTTSHINGSCGPCMERKDREAMAAWMAKTTDEKLLDLHLRLMAMERGPVRY